MKIKVEAKEVIYHSVIIDTEEYDNEDCDNPFILANRINSIKDDLKGYIIGEKDQSTIRDDADWELISIFENK